VDAQVTGCASFCGMKRSTVQADLCDPRSLAEVQRKIAGHLNPYSYSWAPQNVAAQRAECAGHRLCNRRRIKVPRDLLAQAAASQTEVAREIGEGVAVAAVRGAGCAITGAFSECRGAARCEACPRFLGNVQFLSP
jgi:hypothetical protein